MLIGLDDLNKLGDNSFEKLIKALLIIVIGKGIIPFSQGKDGAREATFVGKSNYPSDVEQWDGYWIFQVKFSDISLGIDKARKQIQYAIENELRKLEEYEYLSQNKCDNYIYITNVSFSGAAEVGLHDYVFKKKQKYRVKNFHYWDGEKVATLINSHPVIRDTFFPIHGVSNLSIRAFEDIDKIFVKPRHYEKLKATLLTKKIINIVGQPHVGKTYLAKYLALEILGEQHLNTVLFIQLIDSVLNMPNVENCVIVFDDLYGDTNYETLGRRTKLLSTLQKKNYLIVTSRDYIFEEANKNRETINHVTNELFIIQEGAYSDDDLRTILVNHLNVNFPRSIHNEYSYNFLLANSTYVIKQLRFPHNIQLFTQIIDETVRTKKQLDDKISQARTIDDVVVSWINGQSEVNKNILLTLAVGRIQVKKDFETICYNHWNYSADLVDKCVTENQQLVFHDGDMIRFVHPSYKTAIIRQYKSYNKSIVIDIVINLITNELDINRRMVGLEIVTELFDELDTEIIKELLLNQSLGVSYLSIAWVTFIRKNREDALDLLIYIVDKYPRQSPKHSAKFLATKDFMKDKEILSFVKFLFTKRALSKKVDELITHFSFRLGNKARVLFERLDPQNSFEDLTLKIKILGAIGSRYPEDVFDEIAATINSSNYSLRNTVYSSINMLHNRYNVRKKELFEAALANERHKGNVLKLERSLKSLNKETLI